MKTAPRLVVFSPPDCFCRRPSLEGRTGSEPCRVSLPLSLSLSLSLALSLSVLCAQRAQNNRFSAVARPPTKLPCFPPLPPPLPLCVSVSLRVPRLRSLACVSHKLSVPGGASLPAAEATRLAGAKCFPFIRHSDILLIAHRIRPSTRIVIRGMVTIPVPDPSRGTLLP